MFRKLFRKNAPAVAALPQPVTEEVEEKPSIFDVLHRVKPRLASMESSYDERLPERDQNMERNLLLQRQEIIMEVMNEYGEEVITHAGKDFLSSVFRFNLDAYSWAGRWEQDQDVYLYGEFSEVPYALSVAVEKLDGFLMTDHIHLEVGVSPSEFPQWDRHDLVQMETEKAVDALTVLLEAYMSLSEHDSFFPPQVGKYWGWVNRNGDGGWSLRLRVQKGNMDTFQFMTQDNKPFLAGLRNIRYGVDHMMSR